MGRDTYLSATLLSKQPQTIFELVNGAHSITTTMKVDQSSSFTILALVLSALGVEYADRYGSMRSTDGSEFDFLNWMSFILGNVVETKNLEVMSSLVVEVFLAAEVKVWMVLEKSLDG